MDVPGATPVTMPVALPIVATPVLPELHVPLPVVQFNVTVAPTHNVAVPVMAAGEARTVTVLLTAAPQVLE